MKGKVILIATLFAGLLSCTDENGHEPLTASAVTGIPLVGEYSLEAVLAGKDVDLNNDGVANNDLLKEEGCYNGSKMIFTDGHGFIYARNCAAVNRYGKLTCSENIYEGHYEIMNQEGETAVVHATYTDEYGEEQDLMLCKKGNGLYLNYAIIDFPDRNASGNACYATGKLEYVFKKEVNVI